MKKYNTPELNFIDFSATDVITSSGQGDFMNFDTDGTAVNVGDYF